MDLAGIAFLLGRLLFGGFFVYNGINHFRNIEMMSGYAASKGIPSPKPAVAGTGLLLLIGGLSIMLGYRPTIGVAAIVLFLLPTSFLMHAYWKIQDPMQAMGERVNFNKNIGLLGGALMLLAIARPWPYSIG